MMKLLPSKNALNSVLLSCTLLFALNASAKEVTLDRSLAATLQVQGQKVIGDLSVELSNSIKAELQRFSMRYTIKQAQVVVTSSTQKKLRQQKQQTSEE